MKKLNHLPHSRKNPTAQNRTKTAGAVVHSVAPNVKCIISKARVKVKNNNSNFESASISTSKIQDPIDNWLDFLDLPKQTIEAIKNISNMENISRIEVIRNILDNAIKNINNKKQNIKKGFGLWKNKNIDGLEYQEKLRSE